MRNDQAYHAEPNNILTRNLPFDSYFRQWSHPLRCSWVKSKNRMPGQLECYVTWFCFDFVRLHARCGFCSVVCLSFQVVQIKQVDWKLSTLLCLNVGGSNCKFLGKNPRVHLIIIKEWPKCPVNAWSILFKLASRIFIRFFQVHLNERNV